MKLSCIIVTYFPDISELKKNIATIIDDVEKVIIWENTPDVAVRNELQCFNRHKIIFLGNGDNVGIATALNAGIQWSMANQFTHVLTMDQDSCFKIDDLRRYKQFVENLDEIGIGVYGTNFDSRGSLLFDVKQNVDYLKVTDTITSGSIFPVEVFKIYGGFEEDLFIDAVDYEFCYRLNRHGLKTVIFPSIVLQHKVGEDFKTWIGFKTQNYPAFRTYYIIRNHIAMWRRYPDIFPKVYKIDLVKSRIIIRLIKVILGEKDKVNKILSIIIGIIHGLRGRTGLYKKGL